METSAPLVSLVAAVKKTAVVLKKFLLSELGQQIEATHGREKFDEEITPLVNLIAAIIDHINQKGFSGLTEGPLVEVYNGDYYGDLSGDQALVSLTTEILALENRMQTKTVQNFYD